MTCMYLQNADTIIMSFIFSHLSFLFKIEHRHVFERDIRSKLTIYSLVDNHSLSEKNNIGSDGNQKQVDTFFFSGTCYTKLLYN